ncbi:MAG TPA: multidrug efflux SMR transporter [Oxalicibacterium sp.]|nr:multidrug efflux SMR transporter [Oxalicibacterium sp.]
MSWIYLLIAGLLEVVWAWSMKQSAGFTRLGPTAITFVAMIASFWLLALAMRTLPLGTAYTIWTGIGAVGAFVVGVTVLGEPLTALRMVAVVLIVSGLVLLKLATPH